MKRTTSNSRRVLHGSWVQSGGRHAVADRGSSCWNDLARPFVDGSFLTVDWLQFLPFTLFNQSSTMTVHRNVANAVSAQTRWETRQRDARAESGMDAEWHDDSLAEIISRPENFDRRGCSVRYRFLPIVRIYSTVPPYLQYLRNTCCTYTHTYGVTVFRISYRNCWGRRKYSTSTVRMYGKFGWPAVVVKNSRGAK
jgi:hypothetical protein